MSQVNIRKYAINKRVLILLFLILSAGTHVNAENLSTQTEISILTCSQGADLYSIFGHSAVRVKDSINGRDIVYNFGTFNFNTPNFYIKFMRGNLNYMLAIASFDRFMEEYIESNRTVREQILNLTLEQKQKIADFLERNHRPENRYYRYDFFFDNCATRIRDVLQVAIGDSLSFPQSATQHQKTFREILDQYTQNSPWTGLGINLLLGSVTDRVATTSETMFIPDYLEIAVSNAVIKQNGKSIPLVRENKILFQNTVDNAQIFILYTPQVILWLVFIIITFITYIEVRKNKFFYGIDFLLLFIVGILGLIIFFFWFLSLHKAVINNYNLFWALPTHLVASFFILRKNIRNWLKKYLLICGLLTSLLLILWLILPHKLDLSIMPIMFILVIRSIKLNFFQRIKIA